MINWSEILETTSNVNVVQQFAQGHLTGSQARQRVTTPEFGRVLKQRGVDSTRTLARKALRRRNVTV
jgi:hypothetical protein